MQQQLNEHRDRHAVEGGLRSKSASGHSRLEGGSTMVAVRPRATLFLAGISLVLTISTRTACAQSFKSTGSMTTGRIGHTATLLNGGKVLVSVGVEPTFNYIGSAELYDPSTGAFGPSGNLAAARIFHTATRLNDGKVLVAGGIGYSGLNASAEHYNPSTETFSPTGSMATARIC